MKIWRIISGDPVPRREVQSKSLHLGDWLRRSYVSVGFDTKDKKNPSMRRFRDEMQEGDRVVITTDGYLWALGEIVGPLYEKDEPELYPNRRGVMWYRVTRKDVKSFPASLRNKLSQPHTVVPLEERDWVTILSFL
jgi:predicted Mrr-cat superfamily restriction endonuclease